MKKLVGPFLQVLTMDRLPLSGKLGDQQLEIISNAGILLEDDFIIEIADFEKMAKDKWSVEVYEIAEKAVAVPGYIDAHTHICFAGTRADDFAKRNAGQSYLEIAQSGGGIWSTVQSTREVSEQALVDLTLNRANQHLREGVTTMEVKSGYGLSVDEELKQLRSIQNANELSDADLISTCLSAHIKPKDFDGTAGEYLCEIFHKVLPICKAENLATRVDAFVEEGAFSPAEIIPYLKQARVMGFDITVHADQFHVGGSKVAVQVGARSADHLEASKDKEIGLLVKAGIAAVALPGASLGLGMDFAPARKILDAGGILVIASDWNPGSAPMGDLMTQASVLGTYQKLTNAEVFSALTFRAAHVLNLNDRGILKKGMKADFSVYSTDHINEILYHQGKMKPTQVWKNGRKVK